jgi:aspartate ammonia-lyase
MSERCRREHDLLGERDVPADVYWGIHTLRALENFPISGQPIGDYQELIRALACVKKAAAVANCELGILDAERCGAIARACDELIEGKWRDQFPVDVIQGGAGTSTNMNANEVIANRALELLDCSRGDYDRLHPIEHVNRSQSTNDVYPTAIKIAICFGIERLLAAMARLRAAFTAKAGEFSDILKMGRTQLQDAVPMTLGQEFGTYSIMIEEDEQRLSEAARLMHEINLGATAIGTGINTEARYAPLACRILGSITGLPLVPAENFVEATQDTGAFVQLSGVLKRIATKLSKVCNDLRLLSSGPQAGFGEIRLPPRAAGSSIMPGKVNPIVPEVVNQIAFEVIGNDLTVSFASEAGQLQLNAFEPIIAHSIFKSLRRLRAGCITLADNCVVGIAAERERLAESVRRSVGLATALNPYIGYESATLIAREALQSGKDIATLVLEHGLMSPRDLEAALRPEALTRPRAMVPKADPQMNQQPTTVEGRR